MSDAPFTPKGTVRTAIETAVNGRRLSVADSPADVMALGWLRAQGLISVKEGCGEGDCGACTVALGTPTAVGMSWRAVNACLLFLPMLDGRAVLTAEGLGGAGAPLHPVQEAMARHFATQCGFCSPGFVMSLFALSRHEERGDRAVFDALAGNLCRCTGYRPLIETARALPVTHGDDAEAALADELAAATRAPLFYRAGGIVYFAPAAVDEALAFRAAHPDAWVLAGGTDLGLFVTKRDRRPQAVLSLGRVDALHRIETRADGIVLGAAAPYVEVMAALADRHPDLADYLSRVGATQVRNQGTLGGNLGNASPIGDSMPALIALDASVALAGPAGQRRLAVEDFVTGYRQTALAPDEIIASVDLPNLGPDRRFFGYKVARRVDQDISTVSAAFVLEVRDGRVLYLRAAFGGVAARPVRARHAEAALVGRPWTAATVAAAKTALMEDIAPLDDFRGSAAYRRTVAANLIERLWRESGAGDAVPIRLEAL